MSVSTDSREALSNGKRRTESSNSSLTESLASDATAEALTALKPATDEASTEELTAEELRARTDSTPVAWVDRRLTDLFDRVNLLLGDAQAEDGKYRPKCPETLEQAAISREEVEGLTLKYLAARGVASGRQI